MSETAMETVTVFRSGEANATDEAMAIVDMLADAGLNPMMLTDDYPGVLTGTVEVRVPVEEETAALDTIDAQSADEAGGDATHGYDLVELYRGSGSIGEVESLSIRSVLDANHIPSVLVGGAQMPNLAFRVMVPMVFSEAAQQALGDATAAGPAAAEEGEAQSERASS